MAVAVIGRCWWRCWSINPAPEIGIHAVRADDASTGGRELSGLWVCRQLVAGGSVMELLRMRLTARYLHGFRHWDRICSTWEAYLWMDNQGFPHRGTSLALSTHVHERNKTAPVISLSKQNT